MTDPNNKPRDPEPADPLPPEESRDLGLKGEDEGKDEVTPKEIAAALKSDEVSLSAAKTLGDAAERVVIKLGLEMFIDELWGKIAGKLNECEQDAIVSATFGGDVIFISMAIPLVNGVIHVGSTREKLTATTEWISKEWRNANLAYDPERIPVISALTLIYLITKGWNAVTKEWDSVQSAEGPELAKKLKTLEELESKGWEPSQSPEDQELAKLKDLRDRRSRWERMRERMQRLCSDKANREVKNGPGEREKAG